MTRKSKGISSRRSKLIEHSNLIKIEPLTKNQERFFKSYDEGKNIICHGFPGTGKSFITIYKALHDILDYRTPYDKLYIVRSLVPTREIGFLPGGFEDKAAIYEIPYKHMIRDMFDLQYEDQYQTLYANLKGQNILDFWCTSFLRGITFDRAIIIVDEFSNLNFHELDSIITRVGEDSKIFFCGDEEQSDLTKQYERNGIVDFMKIVRQMKSFDVIDFEVDDVVRSGLVREYLIAKHNVYKKE